MQATTLTLEEYRQVVTSARDKLNKALLPLGEAVWALKQTADENGYYPSGLSELSHLVAQADEITVKAYRYADFSVSSALCDH